MKYAQLKWVVSNGILVSFATEGPPQAKVWDDLIRDLSTKSVRKYLVTTVGKGELNSLQRKQIAGVFSSKKIGVVVVTDDSIARHIATAISWLGVDIKAFPWKELRHAIQHVGAVGIHEERMIQIIGELKRACSLQG